MQLKPATPCTAQGIMASKRALAADREQQHASAEMLQRQKKTL
jgi:hypothetical protein